MTKSTPLTQSPKMWDYYVSAITTKFAAFKGVATRKEYWSFVLFYALLCLPFVLLESISIDLAWLTSVYEIVFFIPAIAVLARRMHDVGWSAWLMLTIVAPFIAVFLPTNKNSKYAKEESQPLTKGKKITIAVILSLLSIGTIADTIYTNKQINNALNGLERLGKQLESVGDKLEKIGDKMEKSSDSINNKFSEIFTALCYEVYTNANMQKDCLQTLNTYMQAVKDGKYKTNCAEFSPAIDSYNAYLNESRSYGMSGITQINYLAVAAIEVANSKKCNPSAWIDEDLPAIEEYLTNKTKADNLSQRLEKLQNMSADDSEDLILQGMKQGYINSCSATCDERPDKKEMCRCVCQSLAQTMSLQDFQYLVNYGEAEWIKLDSAKNRLQSAINKCSY